MVKTRETLLAKAKQIYFTPELIHLVDSGKITKTIRAVTCTDLMKEDGYLDSEKMKKHHWDKVKKVMPMFFGITFFGPYLKGDILYVKEPWRISEEESKHFVYFNVEKERFGFKWKSPILMPKDAARIILEVVDVELKRIQDLTEEDVNQAGFEEIIDKSGDAFEDAGGWNLSAVQNFSISWNLLLDKKDREKYNWDKNPWVWVYEFKRISI